MKKISREEAIKQGLTRFFTGKPCIRGHIAWRGVTNKACSECSRLYMQKKRLAKKEGIEKPVQLLNPMPMVFGPFISKKKAKEQGLKYYFTGLPCVKGGISIRLVNDGSCLCQFHKKEKFKTCNEYKFNKRKEERDRISSLMEDEYVPNKETWLKAYKEYQKINNVMSLKEAKEKGLSRYFTGIPCIRGHLYLRDMKGKCIKCRREDSKDWDKRHPESIRKDRRISTANYIKKNPILSAIRARYGSQINYLIKRGQTNTKRSFNNHIGIDAKQFVNYLESQFTEGMSWENRRKWHIDHIRPCSKFNLFDEEQLLVCYNWRNLRPLWGRENIQKYNSYTQKDELIWERRMRDLGYEGELFLKYKKNNFDI